MKLPGYTITSPPAWPIGRFGDHPGGISFRRVSKRAGDRKWLLASYDASPAWSIGRFGDHAGQPSSEAPLEIHWQEVEKPRNESLRDFVIAERDGGEVRLVARGEWRLVDVACYYVTLYPGLTHCNGMSGGARDTSTTLFAAFVHDVLYRASREGLLLDPPAFHLADPSNRAIYLADRRALREAADLQMCRHLLDETKRDYPPKGRYYGRRRAAVVLRFLRFFGGNAWLGEPADSLGERIIHGRWGVL